MKPTSMLSSSIEPKPSAVGQGIAISATNWGWRHADRSTAALAGLNIQIPAGQRVLLAGASGAGKSTLLYALAGVLHEDDDAFATGELLIGGQRPERARGLVGLMQQDPETQVVQARVGDDVAFGAENLAVSPFEIQRRVLAALEAVGLELKLDHPTSALSGGQKQRLALAGILAMGPGLVLLDEPTANLDPQGVLEVRDAVIAAVEATGATLLIVEHRLDAWAPHMDRVLVLEPGGGIIHDGTPEQLFAPGSVREELITAGVWVPGYVPELEPLPPLGAATATSLLQVSDVSVSRNKHASVAAQHLSLELLSGSAWCVRGANGAGKSTFALTLGGLLPQASGTIVATENLGVGASQAGPYDWRATELVGRIGSVFQEPEHQFVTASVREELAFGPRLAVKPGTKEALFTPEEIEARVDELLHRLRLEHLAEANPFTLSGGEKRRLSVATVLASSPAVLILDEPTFGQDANTWRELALLLREELARGTAVVAVTHDEAFALTLGAEEFFVTPAPREVTATSGQNGLLETDIRGGTSFLGKANPLAKLVAVGLATIPLIASMDWVSSSLVVAVTLLLLPLAGLSLRRFFSRAWPLLVAALFAAWGTALVGNDSGAVLVNFGLVTITEGSAASGAATGMRAFAIAIPAVLVLFTTDPTDLANALAQKAKLPHRFVLGALAGMRLLGLLIEEWTTLGMARRARGVGSRGSMVQRLKANLGQVFGLLVQAIRRASRLAVTMEAKGFGTQSRTWVRDSVFTWRDLWIVVFGAGLASAAILASVLSGSWNLVWG